MCELSQLSFPACLCIPILHYQNNQNSGGEKQLQYDYTTNGVLCMCVRVMID